jgi:DNA polymerase III epsilon subunit-like protein
MEIHKRLIKHQLLDKKKSVYDIIIFFRKLKEIVMSVKCIIFDTETTGLSHKDRIIQIGSIIFDNKNEDEVYDELCFTDINIHPNATAVNGITNNDLIGKELFINTSFYKRLLELNTADNYLIAHNINFDLGMLKKEGFNPNLKLIDTLRVARHFIKDSISHQLQDLREHLNLFELEKEESIKYDVEIKAHDAIGDVLVTKLLFNKLIEFTKENYPDINPIEKMHHITCNPMIIEDIPFGKYKGEKIIDIAKNDYGYIKWLLSLDDLNIDLKYSLKMILNKG